MLLWLIFFLTGPGLPTPGAGIKRRRVRSQTESEASRSTVSSTMAPLEVPDPSRNIQLSKERIGIVAGVLARIWATT